MKRLAILLLLLLLGAAAVAAVWSLRVRAPYRGYVGSEQFVEVPAGAGTQAIGDRLVAAGVVRDQITYRIALWMSGQARRLEAGEYRFDQPMTALDVIGKIARGDVYVVAVTFPEGLTIADMSKMFESHGSRSQGHSGSTSIRTPRTGMPSSFMKNIGTRVPSKSISETSRIIVGFLRSSRRL